MSEKKQIKAKQRTVCQFARLSMLKEGELCSVCFLKGAKW